jgi:hypothetical protein
MAFSMILKQYIKLLILPIRRYGIIFSHPSILLLLLLPSLIRVMPRLGTLQEMIDIWLHLRLAGERLSERLLRWSLFHIFYPLSIHYNPALVLLCYFLHNLTI